MYLLCFLRLLIDAGWQIKTAIVKNGWLEVNTVGDIKIYEKLFEHSELASTYNIENL